MCQSIAAIGCLNMFKYIPFRDTAHRLDTSPSQTAKSNGLVRKEAHSDDKDINSCVQTREASCHHGAND